VAFDCSVCHVVPTPGDLTHIDGYVPTTSLADIGHHGDVAFSGPATEMIWDVAATQGTTTLTARGTCLGGCHSDGNDGAPNIIPYWAGDSWSGSCNNCHDTQPGTGRHGDHRRGGITCRDCHPAASSPTHLNGVPDISTSIDVTTCPSDAERVSCSGTCHDTEHSTAECW
jgi:hypothetical protein